MAANFQINPKGSPFRPSVDTYIYDNTTVDLTEQLGGGTVTSILLAFASPKGRDNKVMTFMDGYTAFKNEFGEGPFSLYGQPFLNAVAAAKASTTSDAMIHCIRVMPDDAAYSNVTLVARYKADTTAGTLNIQYAVKPSDADVTTLDDLATACTVATEPDAEGYTEVKLFTLASRGRGTYGKTLRFRISSDSSNDKLNIYKNYFFNVLRNESILEQVEVFDASVSPDAMLNNQSLFIEDVIDNSTTGSSYITMVAFPEGFDELFAAYLTAKPDTTLTIDDFDPLLGINKYTRGIIEGLVIEPVVDYEGTLPAGETAVNVTDPAGVALLGGSDGALAPAAADRDATLNALYKKAFTGELDPNIMSKSRFPTTFVMDANFDVETKLAIAALVLKRTDCTAMFDFGTQIYTRESVIPYWETNFDNVIDDRVFTFEPYCMKVVDPYNGKAVTVTSTYWLCNAYPPHIAQYAGKQKPLAGNKFGVIEGYVPDSVYPVFDGDLHEDLMDECADRKLNIASYNPSQVVVRDMQNTSQTDLSALTEFSNVLVLLDVKRDCEILASRIEYEFNDESTIARFNLALENITNKYSAAQVTSITAAFSANEFERARSIIHLNVAMVMKDVIKKTIIEIDVNRA